ncbi:MAG: hypothetical protein RBU45_13665 [Myxococcota bacterium]|jgi:hypothetical protein|nr:hypothetical protein [Myxococcota bacterium]
MIELDYTDGDEPRSWEILKDIDRRQAVELFPDFDVAYLRAAYITPSIDDHEMAEPQVLEAGLPLAVRKSELLGRLACWHMWNTTTNEFAYGSTAAAVRQGVQSLVAGPLPRTPGSRQQVFALLTELMRLVDRKLSDELYFRGPRVKLGERQLREVRYTAETCVRSFPVLAEEAREVVRERLLAKL